MDGIVKVVVDIGDSIAEAHDLSLQSLWTQHVLELAHFFKPLAVRDDAVAGLIGEIEPKEYLTVSTLTALQAVDHAEALSCMFESQAGINLLQLHIQDCLSRVPEWRVQGRVPVQSPPRGLR